MKQFEVLQWAFSFLKKGNREENVADILLQHVTKQSASAYYANMQNQMLKEEIDQFKALIIEHVETGKPVQHMLGYTYFYGRKFTVNKHVLIPRFETEELVQTVIHYIENTYLDQEKVTVVDIGTGSGIIAITLKLELPKINVVATDISEAALEVAKKNAFAYDAQITWQQGDFLQPIIKSGIEPTIIVSNPPYIKEQDRSRLSDTVKNFDPELALFAGDDGLEAYKTIIQQSKEISCNHLDALFFEIGYDQGAAVKNIIAESYPSSYITIQNDINGNERIVFATL